MKKITFEGWKNCVEMVSGDFRIVITTEIGPRVIGGFVGDSANIFNVDPALAGTSGAKKWVNYGGHRLWHAPEMFPRTYELDNTKATAKELKDGSICFTSGTDKTTGIYKSITIKALGDNKFRVEHRLRNDNMWDIELAPWALSVMAPGGVAIAPQNKAPKALLPNSFFAFWPYTEMNDPRLKLGKDFVMVHQKKDMEPLKIGFNCENGWIAYANQGTIFVKSFEHYQDADYPDNGCSIEIYTCSDMLEAETLGPLGLLAPGDEVVHTEEWLCIPGPANIKNEKDAAKYFPVPTAE
ncbi:MAG: hypothetical protein J6W81_01165 [Lentisphaeria bacterium]|nr:hypothetical protein [Lentisphaeria bacterium]